MPNNNILSDVCQNGWKLNRSNCRCYKFVATPTTWTEANKICQRIAPTNSLPNPPVTRRHLAAIANKQENDFVANLAGGKRAWIGGTQLRDKTTWAWTDGQKWEGGYTNWSLGQPDDFKGIEYSLEINFAEGGLWNDANANKRQGYVCQYLDLTKLDVCNVCGSS